MRRSLRVTADRKAFGGDSAPHPSAAKANATSSKGPPAKRTGAEAIVSLRFLTANRSSTARFHSLAFIDRP